MSGTASEGISGYGTTFSGSVTGDIGFVRSVSVGGMSAGDINISHLDSPGAWEEFIAGMKDAGDISLDVVYERTNHAALQAALGGSNENWTITFPDGSTFVCSGYINNLGVESPREDAITQSVSIKLSGAPTFNAAS